MLYCYCYRPAGSRRSATSYPAGCPWPVRKSGLPPAWACLNASLRTQLSKASRLSQRVNTKYSSPSGVGPHVCLSNSKEWNPGDDSTPALFANCSSTLCPWPDLATKRLIAINIVSSTLLVSVADAYFFTLMVLGVEPIAPTCSRRMGPPPIR